MAGPSRGPGGVGRPGRGWESILEGRENQEAFLEGQEWSRVSPRGWSGIWESLLEGQEGSGGSPEGSGGVGRSREALPVGWEGPKVLQEGPENWEALQ